MPAGVAPPDRIELRGLRAVGTHGALPEEHRRAQPFEVDLAIEADLAPAGASDALGDTIDYGAVSEAVLAVLTGPHADLLEHLAARIVEAVGRAAGPRAVGVTVTVRKLRPPVPVELDSAAVTIHRGLGAPPASDRSATATAPPPPPPDPVGAPTPLPGPPGGLPAGPGALDRQASVSSYPPPVVERPWTPQAISVEPPAPAPTASGPPPTRRAFLALGSNLGDRWSHLAAGLALLPDVVAVSSVYETDPVGGPGGQEPYLNAVVELRTARSPQQLLRDAQAAEAAEKRVRAERWGPRTLDVDVLLVGDLTVDEPDLTVPHPRLWERGFVLVPLADLAPDLVADRLTPQLRAGVRPAGTLGAVGRRSER